MRRLVPFLGVVVLLTALSSIAHADSVVTVHYINGTLVSNGYVIGRQNLIINGGPSILGVCIDFAHQISPDQSWTATSGLLSSGLIAGSQLSFLTLNQMQQIAWLAAPILTDLSMSETEIAQRQFAIWGYTGGPNPFGSNAFWQNQAANAVVFSANVPVLVFDLPNTSDGQGMVTIPGVPEPVSLFLFGTGLAAAGAIIRRRRPRNASFSP